MGQHTARRRGSSLRVVAMVAVAALGLGTVASAEIPTDGTFYGCVEPERGLLRVLDPEVAKTCEEGEIAITWNQEGPPGPRGLRWRGTWVFGETYEKGDAVARKGGSYIAVRDNPDESRENDG